MRRMMVIGMTLVLAVPVLAQGRPNRGPMGQGAPGMSLQPGPGGPRRPAPATTQVLRGEDELRWIIRRLDLTDKQQEHAEGLIEEYNMRLKEPPPIQEILQITQQIKSAQQEGDQAKVKELQGQLNELLPTTAAREQFVRNLRQVLEDEQKERLDRVLAFLEANPSGQMRPIDIYVAATELDLTMEQRKELAQAHREYREKIANTRNQSEIFGKLPLEFEESIRAVLTETQREEFDRQLSLFLPKPGDEPAGAEAPPQPGGPQRPNRPLRLQPPAQPQEAPQGE